MRRVKLAGCPAQRDDPPGASRRHGKAGIAVRGPAASLLLGLTRRLPPADPAIEIFGEQAPLTHWLEHTPF